MTISIDVSLNNLDQSWIFKTFSDAGAGAGAGAGADATNKIAIFK